ncbi:aminoglycoside N(3)-acetyltransferase [Alkalicoccus daliensis]|uniref:Aminoglycoside N(3)-acetyltransferase n=1 Tax=Alkalicoccus daliensis TaxID=745820 RepID=A0A1H0HZC3_9BACI|nr:AAC(3) family N-acetyltransferase [Alkalicoccus daliensis]SDO24556.1 aminoglycoside 3-N-acetyltransferase [Alkalicoccus daliensis]
MKEVVENTNQLRTKDSLKADLQQIGVNPGDTLLVHSSLKAMGFVSGGQQAVIEALCEAVGREGNIVMPAQSGDWSDPAEWEAPPVPKEWHDEIRHTMPAFDPAKTPTRGMGSIPELFRTFPQVVRSVHPAVSFAAWGQEAGELMQDHSLNYGLGEHSPLSKLEKKEAKVLLLGTGYDTATCFHLAEYRIPSSLKIRKGAPILNVQGNREWVEYDEIEMNEFRFSDCGMAMERTIEVNLGKIGSADSKLFSLSEAVAFAVKWLDA